MERDNARIGDVIQAVDAASAAELAELARIRDAVESLKDAPFTPRSVTVGMKEKAQTKEQAKPAVSDEIVAAMQKLNLGRPPEAASPGAAMRQAITPPSTEAHRSADNQNAAVPAAQAQPRQLAQRKETITPAQRVEAATKARNTFNSVGAESNRAAPGARDSRGRFVGRSGSKAASDEAKAERLEKQRHQNEEDERGERASFLKKLVKAAGEIDNPSETRAADAVGYAVGGPLWAIGKELGGITKEVGSSVNNTRKSMAEVFRGKDDRGQRGGRRGLFSRRSQNSADVVQLNTQKRTVQELAEQTDAIKEGDQKIIDRLDKIAGHTGKKSGGFIPKLFQMLGKGTGGVMTMLGGLVGGGLLKKILGRFGRKGGEKAGAKALGGFSLNKIARALFGGGARATAGAASEAGGAIAAKGISKLGIKLLGKGLLRSIPIVGQIAGGLYDAVTGWNDTEGQKRAFGLKDGEEASFQQKTAYSLANVLDMGGLVSGISSALGRALESLGFTDIGKMLQFTTEDMAKTLDEYWTGLENAISGLGKTIADTFTEYTSKIGETVSGWLGGIKDELTNKLNSIVDFFSVENLKKVFQDAISELIDFIKHPVDHVTNRAKQLYDSAENKVTDVWNTFTEKTSQLWGGAKNLAVDVGEGIQNGRQAIVKGTDKALVKAVQTAKDAPGKAADTFKAIAGSDAMETASAGAQYLDRSIGQTASSVTNTARAAGTDASAYETDKHRFNEGKDVKIPALNSAGKQYLNDNASLFSQLEQKYGLESGVLSAITATESSAGQRTGHPTDKNGKVLSTALGPFQILEGTRKDLGLSDADAMDTGKSADAAARYLSQLMEHYNGDQGKAIAAYHAGRRHIDKGQLVAGTGEYVTRVRGYQEQINKGAVFGSKVDNATQNFTPTTNTKIDEATGIAFNPGEDPFVKGGLLDKIGEKTGINNLTEKFTNGRSMQVQAVQGSLIDRLHGPANTTAIGDILPRDMPTQMTIQQPTARMHMDGRTISDLGGSGAKPTMQLADNTVSLDSEAKRLLKRMTDLLDSIEGHTKEASKHKGATIKVNTPQPGVTSTVPLSINDPLMNDYARVD